MTTPRTISTIADLAAYLCADSATMPRLNRRIYKDTECGASISVQVYTGPAPAFLSYVVTVTPAAGGMVQVAGCPAEAHAAVRDYFCEDGADRVVGGWKFPAGWQAACESIRDMVAGKGVMLRYFPAARHGLSVSAHILHDEADVLRVRIFEQAPRPTEWYHNGSDADLTGAELAGFTIQTIVEGSDATVDSDVFRPGVAAADVDAWIADMEAEASALWEEANAEEEEDAEEVRA